MKTWNEHMKNYNKKNESSYLTYLDANNLHGWAMALKLPVNGFMWYNEYLSDFNEDFIKKLRWKWWRIFSWSRYRVPKTIIWLS